MGKDKRIMQNFRLTKFQSNPQWQSAYNKQRIQRERRATAGCHHPSLEIPSEVNRPFSHCILLPRHHRIPVPVQYSLPVPASWGRVVLLLAGYDDGAGGGAGHRRNPLGQTPAHSAASPHDESTNTELPVPSWHAWPARCWCLERQTE